MTFEFENGTKARSKVTGFEGIIDARANHLYGCDRYHLQPRANDKGEVPSGCWFDEEDIEVIQEKAVAGNDKKTGGFPSAHK